MGICESKNNEKKKEISAEIHTTENEYCNMRINQCIITRFKPFKDLEHEQSKEFSKVICIIVLDNGKKGTGFFLRFKIDQEWFNCLISNEHVIPEYYINNNNNIYIHYDDYKKANIKLDKNKRYIKSFTNQKLDISVVEILEKDNINRKDFLEPDLDIDNNNNKLINDEILIPQYIEEKLKYAEGTIKDICGYEITHLANTIKGSSGSPIFLKNGIRLIGIHKGGIEDRENFGNFIYPVINEIKEDIRKIRNNGLYVNGKYIYSYGKYYIGEFKDNIPNGKGIKYYSDGKILYEGDFVHGLFEGNGKYIWEDGNYYIGEWKNGLRNGKGTIYNPHGDIIYEGDYVNEIYEGNGKYFCENGEYYIGQWKNGLKNGKGTLYYKNGKIKYEGDYIKDKAEGNGKYICENGDYYEGEWKNGLRNGKGKEIYKYGDIYEGDFVDDKWEGYGKYIWKDGHYYVGQWKSDLRHGKAREYYASGDLKFDGEFVDDNAEGFGKYYCTNGDYYKGQFKNNLPNGEGILFYSFRDGYENLDCFNNINESYRISLFRFKSYYIGEFKDGLRNGKGILFYPNNKIKLAGYWIDDEFGFSVLN